MTAKQQHYLKCTTGASMFAKDEGLKFQISVLMQLQMAGCQQRNKGLIWKKNHWLISKNDMDEWMIVCCTLIHNVYHPHPTLPDILWDAPPLPFQGFKPGLVFDLRELWQATNTLSLATALALFKLELPCFFSHTAGFYAPPIHNEERSPQ